MQSETGPGLFEQVRIGVEYRRAVRPKSTATQLSPKNFFESCRKWACPFAVGMKRFD
jgi:hypothetical protein